MYLQLCRTNRSRFIWPLELSNIRKQIHPYSSTFSNADLREIAQMIDRKL